MSINENPWLRHQAPDFGQYIRTLAMGGHIGGTTISAPACIRQFRPYAYNGTGADTLTAHLDDEPDEPQQRITKRQARIDALTLLPPLHCGTDPVPPPGHITAAQAAELLGVTRRTVERYKRDLAQQEDRMIRAKDVEVSAGHQARCKVEGCHWTGPWHATYQQANSDRQDHLAGHRDAERETAGEAS